MNANQCLTLARKHLTSAAIQESSARFCMAEAVARMDEGQEDSAVMWAEKSLAYSVGVFHEDYRKVAEYRQVNC
jgi:antirestriction protein